MTRRRVAALMVIAGAFAYSAAFLALVEFIVRQTQPPLAPLDAFVTTPQQRVQVAGEYTTGLFEGDALLGWRLRPGLHDVAWDFTPVTTNARGLRLDRDLAAKPPGTLRIACFGDSVTFGYRVPVLRSDGYDPAERAYPALLAEQLAAKLARPVEAIPLAVPGYSTHQGLAWLRRDLPALGADVVTLCYGWNDASETQRADRDSMPRGAMRLALRRAATRSQVLMRAVRLFSTPGEATPLAPRVSREEYVANLLAMARRARVLGAEVLIIAPVYRDGIEEPGEARRLGEYRAALRKAAAADGVAMLEVAQLTETAWPENRELFGERIHPNVRGHALLAEKIAHACEALLR